MLGLVGFAQVSDTLHDLKGVRTAMAIELIFRGSIFLTRLFKGKWGKRYSFTTTST
jgi:hypothetical protein